MGPVEKTVDELKNYLRTGSDLASLDSWIIPGRRKSEPGFLNWPKIGLGWATTSFKFFPFGNLGDIRETFSEGIKF